MNKHDWIWVAVRVFGLYLLAEALFHVDDVLRATWMMVFHHGGVEGWFFTAVQFLVPAVAGWYLVRGGGRLAKILGSSEG